MEFEKLKEIIADVLGCNEDEITMDTTFIESHTGLEDVLIEKEIFVRCMRQHKKMKKSIFKES